MDNIKLLEEIGLKKVSDETHIEQKYIKYMVDCDFDRLNRINTLGFVKILSREYNINLDNWVTAFEEYWQENRLSPEDDEKIFIVMDTGKKSKKFFLLVLFIIFGSIGYFTYTIFTKQTVRQSTVEQTLQNNLIMQNQNSVIEENMTTLDDNQTIRTEQVVSETILNAATEGSNDVVVQSEVQAVEENITVEDDSKIDIINTPKTEFTSATFKEQAVIVPKTELWIGVIYLDDFKRRSFLGEGNFSIDISRNQIVTTGHGSFDLKVEQGDLNYNRQSPVRFEVIDGKIKEISWSKFKELNKGNSW